MALADDTYVSQLHARLFRKEGQLFVEDLGSTNGIKVNGRRVNNAGLRPGDQITIGVTDLTFELE